MECSFAHLSEGKHSYIPRDWLELIGRLEDLPSFELILLLRLRNPCQLLLSTDIVFGGVIAQPWKGKFVSESASLPLFLF